jgi:hypothetical protein
VSGNWVNGQFGNLAIRRLGTRSSRTAVLPYRRTVLLCLAAVILACLPAAVSADADAQALLFLLPRAEEAKPWAPSEPPQTAAGQELFTLINGGAELFLRAGFERAVIQAYVREDGRHIQVDIYQMTSFDAAREVFTRRTGAGEAPLPVGDAGAAGDSYVIFRRGRFVVMVAAGDEAADAKTAVRAMAQRIEGRIPDRCP